ncbi:MAG: hypothetical protein NW700_05645 [Nitrospiraceae bacterium]|nr:hypothetical protein [Nitrospira tepida]
MNPLPPWLGPDFNFLWWTFDKPLNVLEQLRKSGVVGARFPTHKGLVRPLGKAERDFTLVDLDREVFLLPLGLTGLRLNPFGIDGLFRPHNDGALGRFEFLSDHRMKRPAGRDVAIPPDGPAICPQRFGELFDPGTVLARITDEDIAHGG